MRGFGTIPDIAPLIRATKVSPMSIAEAYDMPLARPPLVPPSPPRAPDDMTMLGRMKAIRESVIGSWGQQAYEEDIIRGRFFRRSTFILNERSADFQIVKVQATITYRIIDPEKQETAWLCGLPQHPVLRRVCTE